jgi:cation transport ATPase
LAILKVHGLTDSRLAVDLQDRVSHMPGVTACTVAPTTQVAVVSYRPEETTEVAIRQMLAAGGAYVVSPAPPLPQTAALGPQCPVPASYVLAVERLRFALNFRRFLVRV